MMNIKIVKSYEIKLNLYDYNELIKIICLEKQGIYYNIGRTCYYKLKFPIKVNNVTYKYLKIKGNGILENGKVKIYNNREFLRSDAHFGYDENGNETLIESDTAPYGGILLKKALNECDNFELLQKNNVSTLIPVYVFEYKDLFFNKQSMGCSVALCENPYRFDKLLYSNIPEDYREFYKSVFYNEFGYETDLNFNDKNKLINIICSKYTKEIKKFSETGLYIHSGGWSNIQYSFSSKNVVLTDLDSSKKINNKKFILKIFCRDLVSNIYRLYISLYNPLSIGNYNESLLTKLNYCYSLLDGYFDGKYNGDVLRISNEINKYYIDSCFARIKKIEKKMLDIPDDMVKKYELKIFEFYHFSIDKIMPIMIEYYKGGKYEQSGKEENIIKL